MKLREWARATCWRISGQLSNERLTEFSTKEVKYLLSVTIMTLVDALQPGDELRINDLGRLWVEDRPSRRMVSNLGGQVRLYDIRRLKTVRFRASTRLTNRLNQPRTQNDN